MQNKSSVENKRTPVLLLSICLFVLLCCYSALTHEPSPPAITAGDKAIEPSDLADMVIERRSMKNESKPRNSQDLRIQTPFSPSIEGIPPTLYPLQVNDDWLENVDKANMLELWQMKQRIERISPSLLPTLTGPEEIEFFDIELPSP